MIGMLSAVAQALLLVVLAGLVLRLIAFVIIWLDAHDVEPLVGLAIVIAFMLVVGIAWSIYMDGGWFWSIP